MGRPAGIPNKASGAIKELAQGYGADVIRSLADLAGFGAPGLRAEADMTRIVAMRELLDRGFGKAAQPLTGEDGKPLFPRLVVMFGADGETPREVVFDDEPSNGSTTDG